MGDVARLEAANAKAYELVRRAAEKLKERNARIEALEAEVADLRANKGGKGDAKGKADCALLKKELADVKARHKEAIADLTKKHKDDVAALKLKAKEDVAKAKDANKAAKANAGPKRGAGRKPAAPKRHDDGPRRNMEDDGDLECTPVSKVTAVADATDARRSGPDQLDVDRTTANVSSDDGKTAAAAAALDNRRDNRPAQCVADDEALLADVDNNDDDNDYDDNDGMDDAAPAAYDDGDAAAAPGPAGQSAGGYAPPPALESMLLGDSSSDEGDDDGDDGGAAAARGAAPAFEPPPAADHGTTPATTETGDDPASKRARSAALLTLGDFTAAPRSTPHFGATPPPPPLAVPPPREEPDSGSAARKRPRDDAPSVPRTEALPVLAEGNAAHRALIQNVHESFRGGETPGASHWQKLLAGECCARLRLGGRPDDAHSETRTATGGTVEPRHRRGDFLRRGLTALGGPLLATPGGAMRLSPLADALLTIPVGQPLHGKRVEWPHTHGKFKPRRERLALKVVEEREAVDAWSPEHVVIEVALWVVFGVSPAAGDVDSVAENVAAFLVLASRPRHLGPPAVAAALRILGDAALAPSPEAWAASFVHVERRRQVESARAFHSASHGPPRGAAGGRPDVTEREGLGAPPAALTPPPPRATPELALCAAEISDGDDGRRPAAAAAAPGVGRDGAVEDERGERLEPQWTRYLVALFAALSEALGAPEEVVRLRREVRRRGGDDAAESDAEPRAGRSAAVDASLRAGLEARAAIRADVLAPAVDGIRRRLEERLVTPGGGTTLAEEAAQHAAAAAVLACARGAAGDGAAALVWARRLSPAARSRVPRPLLRRLAALRRRPEAHVINLLRCEDRWRAAQRLGLVHGVAMRRFNAVDGAIADVAAADVAYAWSAAAAALNARFDTKSRAGAEPLSSSERACAASHVALWRTVAASAANAPQVVFEDDVVLAPDFATRLRAALRGAPADADVVLLGYWWPHQERDLSGVSTAVLRDFAVPAYFWGLHAYALTPAGAGKLLRHLPVDSPADVFVAQMAYNSLLNANARATFDRPGRPPKRLRVYAVRDKLAKQRPKGKSTIRHTNADDADTPHEKKKRIDFDAVDSLADRSF